MPGARRVLDVGCGTGEHLKHLRAAHGFEVDGLDLDAGLLAVARRKVPDARFFEADMSSFRLGRCYDVIMCLFSSIGYLRSLDRVTAAFGCFREHLGTSGVVIVEPWFAPGALRVGSSDAKRAERGGLRVERTSEVQVEGRLSRVIFAYRIEDAGETRYAREVHELGLFTPAELLASFQVSGLTASYDPEGLTGRGLYVARID